jgi:hypothetical protein
MPSHQDRYLRSVFGFWLGAFGLLLASISISPNAAASSGASPSRVTHPCPGEISLPVQIAFDDASDAIRVGGSGMVSGSITVDTFASSVSVRLVAEGEAVSSNSPTLELGPATPGQTFRFSLPVSVTGIGEASIHVWADVSDEDGAPRFSQRETLYALIRGDRTFAGTGDMQKLQRLAIEADGLSGKLSPEQIEGAEENLARVPVITTSDPVTPRVFSFDEQRMNELVGAPAQGSVPLPGIQMSPTGNITIEGTVRWTDENGATHAMYGANVRIYDEDLGFDEVVTTVVTDFDGNYQAVVDNDDGIGAGDRDIYVQVRSANGWVVTQTTGNAVYVMESGVHDETPDGTLITENFTAPNNSNGESFSVFQAATWIAGYVAVVRGAALPQVDIVWPNGDTKSFYDGAVKIEQPDRWDWDTVHHEFGHYVMDQLDIEDNPGGPHNIGDCISDVHSSKDEGIRMAWGEGWPTYFGTSAQTVLGLSSLSVPRVGDVSYQDLEDGSVVYSLESQDNNGLGEDNEVAVQRLLWDLFDSGNDGRDQISRSDASIWNPIDASNTKSLSGGWAALRAGQSSQDDLLMGEIATDHRIGPSLNSPAEGATVSPASANFSWNRNVGCGATYDGDGFTLRFYNAGTFAPILSLPVGNTTSRALTLGELQTLVASSHQVLWAVEGSNSSGPATGPYLGESFAITVNQPPVADAGPNQTVECESHTTTSAALNGSGSSDPDGDALTYHWTGPVGVTFDDANAMITTGHFPEGVTTVTLTVSDGIESDQDQMQVTVEDTTPPVIVCPANITVECTSHDGTPKDDAQLVPFFSGASATDVCDSTPELTDDAPDYFALGATVVTFTATDADGNASSCQATVTVEDTTPPEITVELNRDVLWPPNHKMSDILATVVVTDICDPNPTFVLTSITSDEPDNGSGDGDTDGDIVADLLTPDQVFQLRSERMGGGDGRKYTIIYTASDGSGNTAPDTACVRVPHDQSGMALCSVGFSANGASLDPQAPGFRLVVVSTAGMDAWRLDPKRVYVGNQETVISPIETRLVDVDQDGNLDLEVIYDAATARDMRALGGKKNPLGLHYQSADGVDYLVSDIFGLGAPIALVEDPTKRDEGELADIIAADDPTDQQPGMSVNTMEVKPGLQAGPQGSTLTLAESGPVLVEIFNVTGRRVKTLVNADLARGPHTLRWDGRDDSGRQMPGGIYFYRVQAPGLQTVKKVLLAR